MAKTITVYEDNRTDKPREVTADEVVEKVRNDDALDGYLRDRAINLALVDFGSFDPQSEEYRAFEETCLKKLRS